MDTQISTSKDEISIDTISDVLIRVNSFNWILRLSPKSIEREESIVTINDNMHKEHTIPVIIRINFSFLFMFIVILDTFKWLSKSLLFLDCKFIITLF